MNHRTTKNGFLINQVLAGRSNAFLVTRGEQVILVDTGIKSAFPLLVKNILSLGFNMKDITTLVLTHTHYDHCHSANQIKNISNCRIMVSSAAYTSIKNGYTEIPRGTTALTKMIAGLGRLAGKRFFGYESFQPDVLISGEDPTQIGDGTMYLIPTPGHSIDSVSMIVDDEIAIVGDAMFGIFRHKVMPPFADDMTTLVTSWGTLLKTGCQFFLPGHGQAVDRSDLQKACQSYVQKTSG